MSVKQLISAPCYIDAMTDERIVIIERSLALEMKGGRET